MTDWGSWHDDSLHWSGFVAYEPPWIPAPIAEPEAPPVIIGWGLCLTCDKAPMGRLRAGMCHRCYGGANPTDLAWCHRLMGMWRKWKKREKFAESFDGEPSPWQVGMLRLAHVIGTKDDARGPAMASRVRVSPETYRAMVRGSVLIPERVRDLLRKNGERWFREAPKTIEPRVSASGLDGIGKRAGEVRKRRGALPQRISLCVASGPRKCEKCAGPVREGARHCFGCRRFEARLRMGFDSAED